MLSPDSPDQAQVQLYHIKAEGCEGSVLNVLKMML